MALFLLYQDSPLTGKLRSCIVKKFFGKFSKSLTEENSSLVSFLAKLENGRSYPRDCFWTIDFNKQAPKTVLL